MKKKKTKKQKNKNQKKNNEKKEGVMELVTAFSRLQVGRKIYVQDRIHELSVKISDLILNKNAYVYVCGDASKMAKEVEQAFVEILALQSNDMNLEMATKYIKNMQKNKRYLQDVWSSVK